MKPQIQWTNLDVVEANQAAATISEERHRQIQAQRDALDPNRKPPVTTQGVIGFGFGLANDYADRLKNSIKAQPPLPTVEAPFVKPDITRSKIF